MGWSRRLRERLFGRRIRLVAAGSWAVISLLGYTLKDIIGERGVLLIVGGLIGSAITALISDRAHPDAPGADAARGVDDTSDRPPEVAFIGHDYLEDVLGPIRWRWRWRFDRAEPTPVYLRAFCAREGCDFEMGHRVDRWDGRGATTLLTCPHCGSMSNHGGDWNRVRAGVEDLICRNRRTGERGLPDPRPYRDGDVG